MTTLYPSPRGRRPRLQRRPICLGYRCFRYASSRSIAVSSSSPGSWRSRAGSASPRPCRTRTPGARPTRAFRTDVLAEGQRVGRRRRPRTSNRTSRCSRPRALPASEPSRRETMSRPLRQRSTNSATKSSPRSSAAIAPYCRNAWPPDVLNWISFSARRRKSRDRSCQPIRQPVIAQALRERVDDEHVVLRAGEFEEREGGRGVVDDAVIDLVATSARCRACGSSRAALRPLLA